MTKAETRTNRHDPSFSQDAVLCASTVPAGPTIPYRTIPHNNMLYRVLYHTIPDHPIPYHTILLPMPGLVSPSGQAPSQHSYARPHFTLTLLLVCHQQAWCSSSPFPFSSLLRTSHLFALTTYLTTIRRAAAGTTHSAPPTRLPLIRALRACE